MSSGPSPVLDHPVTHLRPAPPPPDLFDNLLPRLSPSSIITPSNVPSRQPSPTFALRGPNPAYLHRSTSGREDTVEIPRFKRKELNLGIVRRPGPVRRIAWLVLWGVCLGNGLLSLVCLLPIRFIPSSTIAVLGRECNLHDRSVITLLNTHSSI